MLAAVFILLLFIFVDVWYFIRFFFLFSKYIVSRQVKLSRDEILRASTVWGIVLPSDLDFMLHMNNSKYLREMDFGRVSHYVTTNIYAGIVASGGRLMVASIMIRYRRSLQLWQRFFLQTRILCWDSDAMYLEQRFMSGDGFVCAVALLKMSVKGASMQEVWQKLCNEVPQSPTFPPQVETWVETITRSSESLKKEKES